MRTLSCSLCVFSSVEELLQSRTVDPEDILINLGFGGKGRPDTVSMIPTRFYKPSRMKGNLFDVGRNFLMYAGFLMCADTF